MQNGKLTISCLTIVVYMINFKTTICNKCCKSFYKSILGIIDKIIM